MTDAVLLAFFFILIGGVLVRSARQTQASGVAITEENDRFVRQERPLRFCLFLVAQYGFGVLSILAGCVLLGAVFLL